MLESERGAPMQVNHTQVQDGGRVEIFNTKGCEKLQQGASMNTVPNRATSKNILEPISSLESSSVIDKQQQLPEPLKSEQSPKFKEDPVQASSGTHPRHQSAQSPQQDPPRIPEYVLPLPASLSAPPPSYPPPPHPLPHSSTRMGSPQPRSQSFYPPDIEVVREPVQGMSDPTIATPEKMVDLLPEMAPINGKLDEVVALLTDVIHQSRQDMTHFLTEARDENLKYMQLCRQSYADIQNMISTDLYGNELADKLSGRVQAMLEMNFSNVQKSIELQKLTVKQLENYMLSEQARGNEIATIKGGIISEISSAFGPIQNQLMMDARNFYTAEQNAWAQRFMQLQADLTNMNTSQFRSLQHEIEGSRGQWRQEMAHEQKLELEYQLSEWDRRSSQLAISQTSDVQRYIDQARKEMMQAFRQMSQEFNTSQAGEHDRRIGELQNFITNNISSLEARVNKYVTGPTGAKPALQGPSTHQPALPAPQTQDSLPAPPSRPVLPPPSTSPPPAAAPPQPQSTPSTQQANASGGAEADISETAALTRKPTNNETRRIFKGASSATPAETRARTRERLQSERKEGRQERINAKRNARKQPDDDYVYD